MKTHSLFLFLSPDVYMYRWWVRESEIWLKILWDVLPGMLSHEIHSQINASVCVRSIWLLSVWLLCVIFNKYYKCESSQRTLLYEGLSNKFLDTEYSSVTENVYIDDQISSQGVMRLTISEIELTQSQQKKNEKKKRWCHLWYIGVICVCVMISQFAGCSFWPQFGRRAMGWLWLDICDVWCVFAWWGFAPGLRLYCCPTSTSLYDDRRDLRWACDCALAPRNETHLINMRRLKWFFFHISIQNYLRASFKTGMIQSLQFRQFRSREREKTKTIELRRIWIWSILGEYLFCDEQKERAYEGFICSSL